MLICLCWKAKKPDLNHSNNGTIKNKNLWQNTNDILFLEMSFILFITTHCDNYQIILMMCNLFLVCPSIQKVMEGFIVMVSKQIYFPCPIHLFICQYNWDYCQKCSCYIGRNVTFHSVLLNKWFVVLMIGVMIVVLLQKPTRIYCICVLCLNFNLLEKNGLSHFF